MGISITKDILKKWFIPPGYLTIFRKKDHNSTPISAPDLFDVNSKYRNTHRDERCFILATGPSVKVQDLTILKNELTISVGSFFLHENIKDIEPKYHVFAPCHPPFDFQTVNKIFSGFKESFEGIKEPNVLMGINDYEFSYREFLHKNVELNPNSYSFVNFNSNEELNEHNYDKEEIWDISKSPFAIRTVIYLGIQLAVYMGCKEIYLIGCDHDYLSDTSRTTNHHFYNDDKSYSDKEHLDSFSTERWFYEYYMRWKQYRLMNEHCKKKGIKLYNATRGGSLDVFERKSLENIFKPYAYV